MDFFDAGLYCAAAICAAGTLWRAGRWLRRRPLGAREPLHVRLVGMLRALPLDVLLLRRTWRTNRTRWLAHALILGGFLGLLLFHAMDGVVTADLFPGYESTLDPWQWLRNLFGAAALLGVLIAVARRLAIGPLRRLSRTRDWALLAAVGVILCSGFALEAAKLVSPAVYQRMTDDYFFPGSDEDGEAMRAFWAAEQGMVFELAPPADAATVDRGRELYAESCVVCHADTASAFVSRPLAALLAPAAPALRAVRADVLLWYAHVCLAFLALAALPFAKFFHPVAATANLLLRGGRHGSDAGGSVPERSAPGRSSLRESPAPVGRREARNAGAARDTFGLTGLGMDACTRCAECSLRCSVAPSFAVLGNRDILPSEKLASLNRYASGRPLSGAKLAAFAEGSRICTECLRCTEVCASGIDLQRLWMASKRELAARHRLDPNAEMRARAVSEWVELLGGADDISERGRGGGAGRGGMTDGKGLGLEGDREHGGAVDGVAEPRRLGLADDAASFHGCVQCTTCTSVCPVVAVSRDPASELDLTPQQIMNMLRMGLKGQTLGARMVWSCTTCYKCQEHCPQGVPVADVLFELRNVAAEKLRERARNAEGPALAPSGSGDTGGKTDVSRSAAPAGTTGTAIAAGGVSATDGGDATSAEAGKDAASSSNGAADPAMEETK